MLTRRDCLGLFTATLTLGAAPATRAARAFPDKPVKLVVAFAPGGPTDVLARILANGMSKALGQQVIVDNKAGAGGIIGTQAAIQAAPDGYTILFAGDSTMTVLPQLAKTPPYQPAKDLVPLRAATAQINVLAAATGRGLDNVAAVIAKARANPKTLSFGSAGNGSPSHLVGALFESENGIELTHVPYKGAGPAMTDLLGGQIDMMFVGMPVARQNAHRKEIKLLAVTGDKRSPALPDVPTFKELGVKGLGSEAGVWWAVMAPKGIPQDVRQVLSNAVHKALSDPDARKAFDAQGVDVLDLDAATVEQWMARDTARWAKLIAEKKITTD